MTTPQDLLDAIAEAKRHPVLNGSGPLTAVVDEQGVVHLVDSKGGLRVMMALETYEELLPWRETRSTSESQLDTSAPQGTLSSEET